MSVIAKAIDQAVAKGLAPLLKQHGFKKDGRTFRRSDAESIAVVNVQASRSNFGDAGSFAVNVGRYFPAVAALDLSLPVTGPPHEYECTLRARVGSLMPARDDHWWRIDRLEDVEPIAIEVRDAVQTYALPWLASLATLDDLAARLKTGSPANALTAPAIALLRGRRDEATRICRALLSSANVMFVPRLRQWAAQHGLVLDE